MTAPPSMPATMGDLTEAIRVAVATTGALSLYHALSIVGALAETRALDPNVVAKWAEFFAATLPPNTAPGAQDAVRDAISGFAAAIRAMATLPPGAGRA